MIQTNNYGEWQAAYTKCLIRCILMNRDGSTTKKNRWQTPERTMNVRFYRSFMTYLSYLYIFNGSTFFFFCRNSCTNRKVVSDNAENSCDRHIWNFAGEDLCVLCTSYQTAWKLNGNGKFVLNMKELAYEAILIGIFFVFFFLCNFRAQFLEIALSHLLWNDYSTQILWFMQSHILLHVRN